MRFVGPLSSNDVSAMENANAKRQLDESSNHYHEFLMADQDSF